MVISNMCLGRAVVVRMTMRLEQKMCLVCLFDLLLRLLLLSDLRMQALSHYSNQVCVP